jgi:RNA polymerase sigma-70 factor (ECF subfamily)
MSADALNDLLEKLCGGDHTAAAQAFAAYEPYLRMVVRRQLPDRLRAKFDSVDIVQSVWADVFDRFRAAGWRFTDAAHLKAFLIKAVRNRFIDRYRQYQAATEQERPLDLCGPGVLDTTHQPRPSEVFEAEELWQRMLALCPPDHHELLRLKREGCSLDEIATRTGLHPSSVRRILYDLARRLADVRFAPPADRAVP